MSRGVRDSEAYIEAYASLGLLPKEGIDLLRKVLANYRTPTPTIVLNPPLDVLSERLQGRTRAASRSHRDKVFKLEDTPEFLESLWKSFESMDGREDVLLLRDNVGAERARLMDWINA